MAHLSAGHPTTHLDRHPVLRLVPGGCLPHQGRQVFRQSRLRDVVLPLHPPLDPGHQELHPSRCLGGNPGLSDAKVGPTPKLGALGGRRYADYLFSR